MHLGLSNTALQVSGGSSPERIPPPFLPIPTAPELDSYHVETGQHVLNAWEVFCSQGNCSRKLGKWGKG